MNKLEKAKKVMDKIEKKVDYEIDQQPIFDLISEIKKSCENFLNSTDDRVNYRIIETPDQLLNFFEENKEALESMNKKLKSIFKEILIDSAIDHLFD